MRGVHAIRAALVLVALGMLASLALAGWVARPGQEQDPSTRPAGTEQDAVQEAGEQPARRRSARLVLPWSDLEDLTPRQEAAIREIRTDILNQKDELDRLERQRILEVLTEAQRQRVEEIEAQRQAEREAQRQRQRERDMERRNTTRPSGEDDEQD